jgi:hypothetical protein
MVATAKNPKTDDLENWICFDILLCFFLHAQPHVGFQLDVKINGDGFFRGFDFNSWLAAGGYDSTQQNEIRNPIINSHDKTPFSPELDQSPGA